MKTEPQEHNESEKELAPWERSRLRGFSNAHLQMSADLFSQSIELAKIAIELARLDRVDKAQKRKPKAYLNEASELVNAAALHAAFHPDSEAKWSMKALSLMMGGSVIEFAEIVGSLAKARTVLLDDGRPFQFEGFRSERGFSKFIRRHFSRMIESRCLQMHPGKTTSLKDGLIQSLIENPRSTAVGQELLETSDYKHFAGLWPHAVSCAKSGKGKSWATTVFEEWVALAACETAKLAESDWRANGVRAVDLQSMAETRKLANRAKGRKKHPAFQAQPPPKSKPE